tara:strand:- start:3078 stop:3734 length:657 start_codon:yes stop_codon:yes gene_type:complete
MTTTIKKRKSKKVSDKIWGEYFSNIKGRLNDPISGTSREEGFTKIFEYLKKRKNPIIVETGCYREEDNYEGDGCSTLLFDKFIEIYGGTLISVDKDPKACELASKNTSHAEIANEDSIEFLSTLNGAVDLLYLDSYNIDDWNNDWEAASHHLKELFAAKNIIKSGTLIVVDDNMTNSQENVISLKVGKGRIIAELMSALDIKPYINDYQIAWVWKELD